MERYENFPIHTTAISLGGGLWQGRGIVLEPQARLLREIYRTETAEDFIFLSKQEAKQFALKLCKAWIDTALGKTL